MKIIKQAICSGCNLLCDDVDFKVDGATIASDVKCSRALAWIENSNQHLASSDSQPNQHLASSDSQSNQHLAGSDSQSSVSQFADLVANRLQSASAPLIVGLNQLTMQSQQLAWQIADVSRATIDVSLSKSSVGSLYAFQQQGAVTATLGEIASRSDLIVFWFCDPMTTHPRLIERLTRTPTAKKKRIVVVGDKDSATARIADDVFSVGQSGAADFVREIRLLCRTGDVAGDFSDDARRLAEMLVGCRYGSWIYGSAGQRGEFDDVTLDGVALVRELNDRTCMVGLGLRSDQNAGSGENVLAALSGFPGAVSLARSVPEHNGAEFAAEALLERGECDFVLLFAGWGSQTELNSISPTARKYLNEVPKLIVTADAGFDLSCEARLLVDRPGVSDSGEFCRIDGVSLGAGKLTGGTGVSAADLLSGVLARVTDVALRD